MHSLNGERQHNLFYDHFPADIEALLLGTQESWNAGQEWEKRGVWSISFTFQVLWTNWAREVQALLEQFVRLGHLGLATVEPSGTQILRKYLGLGAVVGLGLSYRTAFNLQLPHRAASAFCQAQRSERFSCREGIWEYQPTLT